MLKNKPVCWRLLFDKRVYTPRAVRRAVIDFGHLGSFSVRSTKNTIEVVAHASSMAKGLLRHEFANYVLGAECQKL